jgi:hypothetical protein
MQQPHYNQFMDYAGAFGLTQEDHMPMDALQRDDVLPDFAAYGIIGFGAYSPVMGCMTGAQLPRVMAEYDDTDEFGNTGLVLTKHFEMTPADYADVQRYGQPKTGALALASDGEIYEWQSNPEGLGGFFKKLIRKAKKGIRHIAKRVKKRIKKFVKRLPLGKQLWKIGSRIHDTAMKLTKTLLKKVGPIAKRIAPIAALVPGIGPAVSAGLMLTGKAYDIAKKVGVKFDSQKRPIIKTRKQGRRFAEMLASEGKKLGKKRSKQVIAMYKRLQQGGGMLGSPEVVDDRNAELYYRMPQYSGMGWI